MASFWNDIKATSAKVGDLKIAAFTRSNDQGSALLLSSTGDVYALGKNRNDCLALESNETREPIKIQELFSVSGVSLCGDFGDALAYTRGGKLYVWGANVHGRTCRKPVLLQNLPNIIDAKCIRGHYLALGDNGKVYEWRGTETLNNYLNILNTAPTTVELDEVIAIACGPFHSLAMTKYGEVYSFGYVWCSGRFSHQPVIKIPLPGETIAKVACGSSHSLASTHSGRIYTWGCNVYGLGDDGCNESSDTPLQVGGNSEMFNDIATNGLKTSAAITVSGAVYMWGLNEKGDTVMKPTLTQCAELQQVFSKFNNVTCAWTSQLNLCQSKDDSYYVREEDSATLGMAMASSFNVKDLSDLTLFVENKPIYLHKYVLQLRSEFFRIWLQEHWTNKHTRKLELTSYNYDVYLSYVWFLYSGEIKTSSEHILDLWDLAVAYREDKLKLCCETLIEKNMSTESIIYVKSRTTRPSVPDRESSTSLEERINEIKADYEKQSQILKEEYIKSLEKLKNESKALQGKDASQFAKLSALLESEVLGTELEVAKLEEDYTKFKKKYLELETDNSKLRKLKCKLEKDNFKLKVKILELESLQVSAKITAKLEGKDKTLQQAFKIPTEESKNPELVYSDKVKVQKLAKSNVGNPETVKFKLRGKYTCKMGTDEKPETKETNIAQTYQSKIKEGDHKAVRNFLETEEIPKKEKRSYEKLEEGYAELQKLYTKLKKEKANLERDYNKLQEKQKAKRSCSTTT